MAEQTQEKKLDALVEQWGHEEAEYQKQHEWELLEFIKSCVSSAFTSSERAIMGWSAHTASEKVAQGMPHIGFWVEMHYKGNVLEITYHMLSSELALWSNGVWVASIPTPARAETLRSKVIDVLVGWHKA